MFGVTLANREVVVNVKEGALGAGARIEFEVLPPLHKNKSLDRDLRSVYQGNLPASQRELSASNSRWNMNL